MSDGLPGFIVNSGRLRHHDQVDYRRSGLLYEVWMSLEQVLQASGRVTDDGDAFFVSLESAKIQSDNVENGESMDEIEADSLLNKK